MSVLCLFFSFGHNCKIQSKGLLPSNPSINLFQQKKWRTPNPSNAFGSKTHTHTTNDNKCDENGLFSLVATAFNEIAGPKGHVLKSTSTHKIGKIRLPGDQHLQ